MSRKTPFLLCFIVGLLLCAFGEAAPKFTEQQYQGLFAKFAERYRKSYETSEFFKRFELFKENLNFIMNFNDDKKNTHTLAMNQFGDMTEKEWEQYKGLILPAKQEVTPEETLNAVLGNVKAKDSLDWRAEGVVNPVYNQGSCGSCWAWAATCPIESAWAIATKQLIPLSVQQLVDCDRGSNGCSGGFMGSGLRWVVRNGGIASAADYPYTGRNGRCRQATSVAKIPGVINIGGREDKMIPSLNIGPVAVTVQANSRGFMFYKSGIISSQCGNRADHAITAVGYGHDDKLNMDYYIVRNSWGKGWGEDGYVRIQRGKNMCGLVDYACLPAPIPKQ